MGSDLSHSIYYLWEELLKLSEPPVLYLQNSDGFRFLIPPNLQGKTKMKHLGRVSVINKGKFQEKNLNRRQFIRRKTRK